MLSSGVTTTVEGIDELPNVFAALSLHDVDACVAARSLGATTTLAENIHGLSNAFAALTLDDVDGRMAMTSSGDTTTTYCGCR